MATKQTTDDEQQAEVMDSVDEMPSPYPYSADQQRQYLLVTYADLAIRADEKDVIPNEDARARVTWALDQLKAMVEKSSV